MMHELSYRQFEDLCRGQFGKFDRPCPFCGEGKSPAGRKRPVLRIWHTKPGFGSFHCARCGASGYVNDRQVAKAGQPKFQQRLNEDEEREAERRKNIALQIWSASVPLEGTLAWRYFTQHRGLHVGLLGDLSHALRCNDTIRAVVALMTDPLTNEPTGIHRTFLNVDGTKRERKMLGRQGVIRLSRDEDVTEGLGLAEGIEKSLAILISGWAPMWCATSAGGIKRFPVLAGVESLTIFRDEDGVGADAARECADRWAAAGCEVRIADPKDALQ